jgi:sulfane dehydrogenase subunit SoxC
MEHVTSSEPDRRRFLKRGVALGAALVTASHATPSPAQPADDPSKLLGGPTRPYGERSRFEQASRERSPFSKTDEVGGTRTPLGDTLGIITPSALHFEVHRSGVPDIDPRKHRLLIHGMVDRPVMLTMDEIRRLPSTSRILFVECGGNTFTEWRGPNAKTGAAWVLAEGADGSGNERSIPLAKALDDVLVAYGQNGEALRPENGYPLRLIVPGWTGNASMKWLRRLKVVDRPYLTRMDGPGQPIVMPDGKARHLAAVMEAKSVITSPSGGHRLPGPGVYEITGLAWSGRGLVRQVEISTDAGRSWRMARLQSPVLPFAHTRFRLDWRWEGVRPFSSRAAPTRPATCSRRSLSW